MENLKKLRRHRKLTQIELAQQIGCTQTHISDMEKGKYQPSLTLAKKLADFFEVSLDGLIGRCLPTSQPHHGCDVSEMADIN